MTDPIGPYMNDDDREPRTWWVPVAGNPYLRARRQVKACADTWNNRLDYVGKRTVTLWDEEHGHEDEKGDPTDPADCDRCFSTLCWTFEETRP